MTALPPDAVADLYRLVAELEQRLESSFAAHDEAIARAAATAQENAQLRNELGIAKDRQNATADILRVISQSPTDVQPIFDAIVLTAVRLLRCDIAFVLRCDGATYSPAAAATPEGPMADPGPANLPINPDANFPSRAIVGQKMLHLPDWSLIDLPEHERRIHEIFGVNSALYLPLLRDGECIGLLALAGKRPGIFGENEITLAESFRDQALIAIENARLFNENTEALARQTATADILRVISQSPTDAQPVFDAIVLTAVRLFKRDRSFILLCDGVSFSPKATAGPEGLLPNPGATPVPIDPAANFPSRAIVSKKNLHLPDWSAIDLPEYEQYIRDTVGLNSALYLPLLREAECIGVLGIAGTRAGAFDDDEIALAESFRDQALIAIENTRLFSETREALERQNASAEILRTIASAPGDAERALYQIAETSARLFDAPSATIHIAEGDGWTKTIRFGDSSKRVGAGVPDAQLKIGGHNMPGTIVGDNRQVHVPDVHNVDPAIADWPGLPFVRAAGTRSMSGSPLRREGKAIGALIVYRDRLAPFTDEEMALQQTFADQAAIAIENARLFNETKEALERQTATADVLKVIASSPSDVQPVFEAIATSANRLIGGFSATVVLFVGDALQLVAFTPTTPTADEMLQASFPRPLAEFPPFELVRDGETVQFANTESEDVPPLNRTLARSRGYRSMLFTPLMSKGAAIGILSVTRKEPGAFAAHHVQLLQTFADQAVIAIENARLFDEVQAKTRDLTESLQQQTATADVLKVISRSAFDLQSVLDTLVNSASTLCNADQGMLLLLEAGVLKPLSYFGPHPDKFEFRRSLAAAPHRGNLSGRAVLDGHTAHVADVLLDPEFTNNSWQQLTGFRAMLAVPLMRQGQPIGAMALSRTAPGLFSTRQIELVTTFADQAVIAIENVRLFDEVQARTRDLTEALTYQTGSANILKVIASSPTEVGPVLKAIVDNACEVCDAYDAGVLLKDGDDLRFSAHHGPIPIGLEKWPINRHWTAGRAFLDKAPVHLHDLLAEDNADFSDGRELSRRMGHRSILSVPLLREGESIGVIVLRRTEVHPFSNKQIALLQTFADQAVIAIGNVRLFEEVQQRTRELAASLDDLRTAQDRLVQTEKLASLGQLTAGIAHEIKNPLNFVNNFAALSAELTDELNDVLKQATITEKIREEVDELTGLLKDNLQKVVQHGQRADSIVKNMLLHSREGSGDHRPADINALVDESLNLAYHGARAERPDFNVTLQRDFDASAGTIEVFPQEITRVFLNLVSNGFYAVNKRRVEAGQSGFDPVLVAATRTLGDAVEIRIRDNGTGIPPEVKDKMFNPFFTTKPAGEGTGLGLSMSHDIIVKQHGGTIDVDTEPGQFTEFRIVLPRTGNPPNKTRGQT